MFNLAIADLGIRIENKYPYVEDLCRGYISGKTETHFAINVTESEIDAEQDGDVTHRGYLESLAVYRKIAEHLPDYDGFLMHGVLLDVDGLGIAFLAKSGVGKSTHMKLWKELLGDRVTVINGDKPPVRIIGGEAYAYGTPWAGKEYLHTNASVKLKKICFIERAEENECVRLDKSEIFEKLIVQIYRSKNPVHTLKTLDLVAALIEQTEFFKIKCNTDLSAAKIASEVVL